MIFCITTRVQRKWPQKLNSCTLFHILHNLTNSIFFPDFSTFLHFCKFASSFVLKLTGKTWRWNNFGNNFQNENYTRSKIPLVLPKKLRIMMSLLTVVLFTTACSEAVVKIMKSRPKHYFHYSLTTSLVVSL